jgi:hypothetical protein
MTEHDTQLLKERDQQLVRLHLIDGEVVTARVLFVSETEQDVIVDLISSANISRYSRRTTYNLNFSTSSKIIVSVEPIPDAGNHQKEM